MRIARIKDGKVSEITDFSLEWGEGLASEDAQVGWRVAGASLRPPTLLEKRTDFRDKVSRDYDDIVDDGTVAVAMIAGIPDQLTIYPKDIQLLTGIAATFALAILAGAKTITDTAVTAYKFPRGQYHSLTGPQLLSLFSQYASYRSPRYIAHDNIKNAIMAGQHPMIDDMVKCGITEADLEGLDLA